MVGFFIFFEIGSTLCKVGFVGGILLILVHSIFPTIVVHIEGLLLLIVNIVWGNI